MTATPPDIAWFEAPQAAVTIARNEQVQTVARLQARLRQEGFSEPVINTALSEWAQRIQP
jgi:hypothetical protein